MNNKQKSTKGKAGNKSSSQQPRKARTQNKNPNKSFGVKRTGNVANTFAPVSQSRTNVTVKPQVSTNRNGDCRIVHREYIKDLVSSSSNNTFAIQSLNINPGQSTCFPWASKLATNFESYRFNKLKFCFETEQATTLVGTCLQMVDYDASDVTPGSKQQMMAYRGSVRSAPWCPSTHNSMKEDLQKKRQYYVRPGAQPTNTDIKEYDVGIYFFGSKIAGISVELGELYVEYDLELLTPLFTAAIGDAEKASAVGVTGQAAANPFGTTVAGVTLTDTGQPLTAFTSVGAGTFTFQRAFTGILVIEYIGTVITAIAAATGTATLVELGASVDAAGLKATQAISIVATQGQTVIVGALTATTVTSAIGRFATYPVSSLG